MESNYDVIVIGSGISGSFAAHRLVHEGLEVLLLDVSTDDQEGREMIPDISFTEIIKDYELSRRILLGEKDEGVGNSENRVGAQLTPTRQFITRETEKHLPFDSKTFYPMQSLAFGGLGAGWGAAAFTFNSHELELCGINQPDFSSYYNEAARIAGISADANAENSDLLEVAAENLQPPLDLDENAASILKRHESNETSPRSNFKLGRIALAILSRDKDTERRANPYHDMDFYSDVRKSIFRPRYLIEAMADKSNFTHLRSKLILKIRDDGKTTEVVSRDLSSNKLESFMSKKVIVCAGAINTGRIILNSLKRYDARVPLLANPYHYVACINWQKFGKKVADRRHSMAQLVGSYLPPDDPEDVVTFQFYSYRALLLFKLAKEFPIPPALGLLLARCIASSFTIVAIWHSCRQLPTRFATLFAPASDNEVAKWSFHFDLTKTDNKRILGRDSKVKSFLRKIGVFPLSTVDTGPAGGIHYAGTLPSQAANFEAYTTREGTVRLLPNIFVGDSASWNYLPAKGLSFTLMANALRVSDNLIKSLRASKS